MHGVIVGLGVGVPLIVAVAVEVAVALAVAVVVLVAVAVALAVGVALTVAVAVAVGVGSGDTSAPATAGNISSARMRMPVATLIPRFLSNSDIGLETSRPARLADPAAARRLSAEKCVSVNSPLEFARSEPRRAIFARRRTLPCGSFRLTNARLSTKLLSNFACLRREMSNHQKQASS